MKKSELKSIVKECIRDVLFEEGVLSSMISEIAIGISQAQGKLLETNQTPKIDATAQREAAMEKKKKLLETKKKMLNAIGNEKMNNVFEGTEPLKGPSESSAHSPLAGKDPNDAGVDISSLFNLAGQRWQNLK